jgi:hypothetical protein
MDTDAHQAAIDAILASPSSTTSLFAPNLAPGLINTWRMVAERGLFAFDSDPHGSPYRLVAAPVTPARIADLPASAVDVVSQLQLPWLRFSNLSSVPKEHLQPR